MRIGFDAKRAFYNRSGLGSYSRDTLRILLDHFPEHEYHLYTPSLKNRIVFTNENRIQIQSPNSFLSRQFPGIWRSAGLTSRIKADRIDLYHGLSHELPLGIQQTGIPSVVTIHDLIFIRYPSFYKITDRFIYYKKFLYSCRKADKIIAISEQTKKDIVHFFKIDAEKIDVVYQGCDPRFYRRIDEQERKRIKEKYHLPENYILCVATVEERKNQLFILQAMHRVGIDMPLVLAGKEKEYGLKVRKYAASNRMKNVQIIGQVDFYDLPALYQGASLFVYPSIFEGFGIPILEALNSRVPVITSKHGCFPEAGGSAAEYAGLDNPEELGIQMQKILTDKSLQKEMIRKGEEHVLKFREENIAKNLMGVYLNLVNKV